MVNKTYIWWNVRPFDRFSFIWFSLVYQLLWFNVKNCSIDISQLRYTKQRLRFIVFYDRLGVFNWCNVAILRLLKLNYCIAFHIKHYKNTYALDTGQKPSYHWNWIYALGYNFKSPFIIVYPKLKSLLSDVNKCKGTQRTLLWCTYLWLQILNDISFLPQVSHNYYH